MITVAALYVDPKGPYPGLRRVECWDEARDARRYSGPHPVVAHPPCQRWGNLARVNYERYGGAHNRPGNDGGCFRKALLAAQRYGGVLEHPAGSGAWRKYGLPLPAPEPGWQLGRIGLLPDFIEWVCEVWQSAYDHPARKKTWLVLYAEEMPRELRWARREGTHQIGWFDRNKPVLGKRQAALTPLPFARELVRLARRARSGAERKAA